MFAHARLQISGHDYMFILLYMLELDEMLT